MTTRANAENGDHRRHRQLPDAVPLSHEAPLPHHSTPQAVDLHNDTDNKPVDHYDHEAPKHAPDPTQVPTSLSYFQVLCKGLFLSISYCPLFNLFLACMVLSKLLLSCALMKNRGREIRFICFVLKPHDLSYS